MVYALIDLRNGAIKCSKLYSETNRLRFVAPLEFVKHIVFFIVL